MTVKRKSDARKAAAREKRDARPHARLHVSAPAHNAGDADGKLPRLSRLYAALIRADQAILRIRDRDRLFQEICDIAITYGDFRIAAVRLLDPRTQTLEVVASRGDDEGLIKAVSVPMHVNDANASPRPADFLREGRSYVSDDFAADPLTRRAHEWAAQAGIGSFAAFPLRVEGKFIGALSFYAEPKGFFQADLVELLSHLADNVSFALENAGREQERAHAEAALRESEARFRGLNALSSDIYWEQDEQFRYTSMVGAVPGGLAPESVSSIIGKTRWELRMPPGAFDWTAHRAQLDAHQPFHDFEIPRLNAEGNLYWVSVSGEPVFDGEGRFRGYRGVTRSITERKRAEQLRLLEHNVNRCLADANDAAAALQAVMRSVCESEGWEAGRWFRVDEAAGVLRYADGWAIPNPGMTRFLENSRDLAFARGEGLAGTVWQSGRPLWVEDVGADARVSAVALAQGTHVRGAFVFPLTAEGRVIGVLSFSSREIRKPEPRLLESIGVIGSEIGQFLERKRHEDDLRESEERYRALTAMSADWFWEQDANFRFTRMSRGLDLAASMEPDLTLGKCRWELPIVGVSAREWEEHRRTLEAREPFEMIYQVQNDRGDLRWFHIRGQPRFDAEGRFRGYRGTGRDFTERRRGEEELQRFRAAMDLSADSITLIDRASMRYVDFNKRACETLGYTREEMLQMGPHDLNSRPRGELEREYDDLIAGGLKFARVEHRRRRKDGSLMTVEISRCAIPSGAGHLIVAVVRDVSERKHAEQLRLLEHAVNRCLADADSVPAALQAAIRVICETEGWDSGRYFGWDAETELLRFEQSWSVPGDALERFIAQSKNATYAPGAALAGRSWQSRQPIWVADITRDARASPSLLALEAGMRGAFVVPVMAGGDVLGVLAFNSREVREPDERLLQAVRVIGSQIGQYLRRKRAEQAMRESEERFSAIFEQAAVGLAHVSLEGRWLRVNRKLCDIVGYPREELRQLKFQDITHPDDIGADLDNLRRLLAGDIATFFMEKRYIRKDGRTVWVNLTVSLMREADGAPRYLIGVIEDISARKHAAQLQALEHAVNSSLANAESASAALRATLGAICEAQGWEVGQYWRADEKAGLLRVQEVWMAPDARAAIPKFIEGSRPVVFASGQGLCGWVWKAAQPLWVADAGKDARVIRRELVEETGIRGAFLFPVIADGRTTGVLEFWSPQVREPDERLLQAVRVIGSQIGQYLRRKQAEEALRESEDRLQQIVRVSDIGIFDHDHRIETVYWSSQQRRIYGWGPDEPVTLQGFLACVYPDDLERIGADVRRAHDPAGDGAFDVEHRIVRRDGEVRWIATRSKTYFEGEGDARRPVRTMGAIIDITERKNTERVRALEHAVNRCLADTDDASAAIRAVMSVVCTSENWECGRYFRLDDKSGLMRFAEGWSVAGDASERFIARSSGLAYARGTGLVGRAWQSAQAIWSSDIAADPRVTQPKLAREAGMHGALVVPVVSEGSAIGVFTFNSRQVREPDEPQLQAFRVIGSQIGQYLRRKHAEEEQKRFRAAMDLSADMINLIDRATMRFIDVNRTACELLGYTREELLQLGPADLIDRPREELERQYDAVIAGSAEESVREGLHRRKDGSVFPVEVHRSAIASGDSHLILAVVRDVSERKRAEQLRLLEHTVNRHIAAAESVPQALQAVMQTICESEDWECGEFWRVDEMNEFLRQDQIWIRPGASEGIAKFFEDSRNTVFASGEGLVGWVWQEGKPLWVADADKDARAVRRGLFRETGLRSTLVLPVISGGRTFGVMTCTSSRVRQPDERLMQALHVIGGQIGQYLQRKQAEEELRRFRIAMDNSADMIVLIDRATMRFVDVNSTACRLLGYSREELLGMGPQDVLPESREDLERIYDTLLAAPSSHTSSVTGMKSHYRRKDGTTFPFESTRHVFRSGSGYLIAAISRDITERIAAQQALLESNERFDFAARATNDIIWDWDLDSDALWWNENFFIVFGYAEGNLAWSGAAWVGCIHPEDRERVEAGLRLAIESRAENWSDEYRFRRSDGSYAHVLDRAHLIRNAGGRALRMIGAMADVTARREDERRIRDQALRQQLMAEFGREALAKPDLNDVMAQAVELVSVTLKADYTNVLELDPEQKRLNYRATAGWSKETLQDRFVTVDPGSRIEYILSQREAVITDDLETDPRFSHPALLKVGVKSSIGVPILGTRNAFGIFSAHSLARRRFGPEDVSFLQGVANILAVAIERKSAEERLAYLAQFDSLTGLPNRHLFRDRLVQTMAQAQRGDWPMAVLFIDLDRFKLVNDSLGHPAGDKLLQEAAARLSACLRSGDTIGRLGGDEFGAILADLRDPADTALVAQKIIDALAQPFAIDGQEAFISASIGITLYPEDSSDAGALIMNADTAMYRAKEQGRSNYQFFTREMNERSLQRVQMDGALRHALERNEFRLHYQPKADLATGRICGIEVLLRWQRPDKGLVSPAEFIPVLEDTGMIVPVGEWVLRAACEQARAWQDAGLTVPVISVNLSARQFQQKNLDATVRGVLEETGIEPGMIELEITESLLMHDPEGAERALHSLKESGVRLSVDDFGTGYSSLGYLKRFPLDTLKIDRTFVRDISADSDDAMLTLAIINLAHNLRLNVIAEGVETEAQLDFLALHACDQIQGYYFSKPVPAEDCERMLRENLLLRRRYPGGANEPALLLLDDSEEDLLLLGHALRQGGFNVLTANSAEQAFKLLTAQAIDVVISDQRMPGMSGVEFLGRVRKLYPRVLRILATSASDPAVLSEAINRAGIDKFLSKHWDAAQLRREVQDAYRQKYVASAA